MTEDKTEQLIKLAPTLFSCEEGYEKHPFPMFGFECGSGWFELLKNLVTELEPLAKKDGIRALQVKEKFGTLRFYTNYTNPEVDSLIEQAEDRSEVTCEACGAPGKISTNKGWVMCRCDQCMETINKE